MTLASWGRIKDEAARLKAQDLKQIVAGRAGSDFVWKAPRLEVDVAKQPLDAGVMSALMAVAGERDLSGAIGRLFAGDIVNKSEHRPALHWALRGGGEQLAAVKAMRAEQGKAAAFAAEAQGGALGFPVKTILHIGIGGSDLGPRLIWDALRPYGHGIDMRFCANVDPDDFREAIAGLDPATTLVIVVSKSFKTPETAANAKLARDWLVQNLGESSASARLAAVSSAPDKARAWGAAEARIFPMDEAVGGRYSLWSSVGLSLQVALGKQVWSRLLHGGEEMDAHFRDAPLEQNTPAKLGMMDAWLHSALDIPTRCVLAYAHRLRKLPDFLQQLEMESNGKSAADTAGGMIAPTAPVVWGSVGTLGQHSFHQLLHQGLRDSAIEFVAAMDAGGHDKARGRALLANAFGQAEAMLAGRSAAEAEAQLIKQGVDPEKAKAQAPAMHMAGGHGSTTILLDDLSPESVGALIAMYEHRAYAAGVMWGINSFDQWGVERGKVLAEELDSAIKGADAGKRDPSTLRLVAKARERFRD